MTSDRNADGFVTRDEFRGAIERIDERLDKRFAEINMKLDSRGASTRQIWMGVGSMLFTALAMGAALVAFSLRSSVAPLEVQQVAAEQARHEMARSLGGQIEELKPLRADVIELRARVGIVQGLVMSDARIDHGGGPDGSSVARLEQTQQRQTELWQLLETLRLQIGRIGERLVAIEGQKTKE